MEILKSHANTKEIRCLLKNLEEIRRLPSIFLGQLYPTHAWKTNHGRFVLLFSLNYKETCIFDI